MRTLPRRHTVCLRAITAPLHQRAIARFQPLPVTRLANRCSKSRHSTRVSWNAARSGPASARGLGASTKAPPISASAPTGSGA